MQILIDHIYHMETPGNVKINVQRLRVTLAYPFVQPAASLFLGKNYLDWLARAKKTR